MSGLISTLCKNNISELPAMRDRDALLERAPSRLVPLGLSAVPTLTWPPGASTKGMLAQPSLAEWLLTRMHARRRSARLWQAKAYLQDKTDNLAARAAGSDGHQAPKPTSPGDWWVCR